MPEVNQITFTTKELVEILIQRAGLHEGKWALLVNFNFAAANFGPSPDEMLPGGVVAVGSVGLQRALPETPPGMTVDAAVVNPAST